jgi:exosortase
VVTSVATAERTSEFGAPSPFGPAPGSTRRNRWAATTLVACGCVPLFAAHLLNLAAKPHYQFAVIVPLGVLLLWARESWDLRRDFAPLHWASSIFLVGAAVGLGAATWWWSPWLGMLSTLLAMLPCLWWRGGWEGWRIGWRGWLFAWALLPLPFSLDEDVTRRLRTVTTDWTSRVLDEFGILHLSYANVIELPGKPLFIADACSGVHSLFVLLTAALFLSMWLRRTLLHTACLLGGTLFIVLIENVSRLVIVAAALQWRRDLSEGPDHLLLGALLFAASLLLVLSLDQFLMFLLPSHRPGFLRNRDKSYYYYQAPPEPRAPAAMLQPHPLQWTATLALAGVFPILGAAQVLRMPRLSVAQVFPRDWPDSNGRPTRRCSASSAIRWDATASNGRTAADR